MKRKIIVITILAIILLSLATISVMAFVKKQGIMDKMTVYSNKETVKNIQEQTDMAKIEETAKNYLQSNKLVESENEEYEVQLINDNVSNEQYYRIQGNGARIEILKENGEVKSYIKASPSNYVQGTIYDIETVENVAKEIFEEGQLVKNKANCNFIEITENLNYFPTAWFEDKTNNRMLFVTFNPDNKEIVNMGSKSIILSENNEVKIDENTAKSIAMKKMSKTLDDIISVELKDVEPNAAFIEIEDGKYYFSESKTKRKAYVVKFNTTSKIEVYVDATTGEIIGGNGVW